MENVPDHGRGSEQDDLEGLFQLKPFYNSMKDFCSCKTIKNWSNFACETCQVQRGSILALQLHGKNDQAKGKPQTPGISTRINTKLLETFSGNSVFIKVLPSFPPWLADFPCLDLQPA